MTVFCAEVRERERRVCKYVAQVMVHEDRPPAQELEWEAYLKTKTGPSLGRQAVKTSWNFPGGGFAISYGFRENSPAFHISSIQIKDIKTKRQQKWEFELLVDNLASIDRFPLPTPTKRLF